MDVLPLSSKALNEVLSILGHEEQFVFLETTKTTEENHLSFLFLNPVTKLCFQAGENPAHFFHQVQSFLDKGYYVAGWIAYELGYVLEPRLKECLRHDHPGTLAELLVFKSPIIFNHKTGHFMGENPSVALPIPSFRPDIKRDTYEITNLRLNQPKDQYIDRIKAIKSYIAAGDTYQVNYTLKFLFDFEGSAETLYKTLRRNQSVSYGALMNTGDVTVLSFSPELFFKKQDNICTVRPMKGTVKRGPTSRQDQELADYLRTDPKNRSENVMIVDLLRNDLGRLCTMGSVTVQSLFDVETFETLHQMTSTIQGELRSEVSWEELFRAIFPCGSVTGAPKIRTMEIIHELELEARGVYTGAIGYFTPTGDAFFNVPIRTVVLNENHGEMGVGSGIVYDSNPESEWDECSLKGKFLTDPLSDFKLLETMLWMPDTGYWLLDLHVSRLEKSARYFAYPMTRRNILKSLQAEEKYFQNNSPQRSRLTLDRYGKISITTTECGQPEEMIFPGIPRPVNGLPKITFSSIKTDPESPFLYHKTTNREIYDMERQHALAKGCLEVIFCNNKDEVTEGSITNVFIRRGDSLITPPVACGLLPGIFRSYFLDTFAGHVQEAVIYREDLENADAVYIANSVRGIVQVALQ